MANLVLNRFLIDLIDSNDEIDNESTLNIEASSVRALIKQLDQLFPGVSNKLQSGYSIAIDGEIFSDPMLEPLDTDSEVYFLPAIEGG